MNSDDKYLLPSSLLPPPSSSDAAITAIDPEEIHMMFQTVMHERPHIANFLDNMNPQALIGVLGWLIGLMHNQAPSLYNATLEAIECGKEVAQVLRGQIEKKDGPHVFPPDTLVLIYPTNLVLHQFENTSDKIQ